MLKKVLFAACASAFLAGATVAAPVTAQAGTCKELAKAKYPDNMRERMSYRRACKRAEKDGGLFSRLKMKS